MALNTLTCTNDGANTGFGDCFVDIKGLVKAFIAPLSTSYGVNETATSSQFLISLNRDILEAKSKRIYPIGGFVNITENSSEPTAETFGLTGGLRIVREGKTDLTFQFVDGGLCLSKSLRKFNGKKYGIFFADSGPNGISKVLGTKSGNNLKPIPLEMIYTPPFKFDIGTAGSVYSVRMVFDPMYLNDAPGWVEMPIVDVLGLNGLQDVVLTKQTATLPAVKVTAKVGCAQVDLYDLYATELAVVGAWYAYNKSTGNRITISSVAVDTNIKGWTLTLDSADPDYSISNIAVNLESPTALNLLGVKGFEGIAIEI